MQIFVLGAGATGSLLAQLLERQGHTVWCGDRDPERARRFLGKRSTIAVTEVNARNLLGIVRVARGCNLIVNASASVFNQIVMRAALRLRAHYVDLSSHLTRNPFKAEQFSFHKRFEEKRRTALINTGAAPGLTNLLVARAAEMLDQVESVQIRLYESSESDDPISQWSPEVTFDEAISSPRVYRNGKFKMEKRFAELEKFRFPDPIGNANVVLAAQDEVGTIPYSIPMSDMDVKIGGNEFDRLRRWYKQGKLSKSRGIVRQRFPQTSSPRAIAKLIRQGVLQNARFAAAVLVRGVKRGKGKNEDEHLLVRTDCHFPTLYQIRQQDLYTTPVAYATAHVAALFIKNFPRELKGVFAPETLPPDTRRAIIAGIRNNKVKITQKITKLKPDDPDDL
ncbi:MAG TPA: saccharopine dehydrogenase NADP-binding domain-containing protein [Candidatus Eremiobacteraceae bacterium]|jgi:saccharopine dehydrogenase-like NADP-dependent oxidoreductase|nr:saccharopine dehydrogenase NADP-binding domain-containing protein [Candidatus Eremiobacteraceae bacterium]